MTEESKLQLASLLEADGVAPAVVKRLRDGYYDEFGDDYDDSLPVAPLVTLVEDLRKRGLKGYAQRVMDGEFDASSEDSRRWAERQTGETSRLIDALGLRGPAQEQG